MVIYFLNIPGFSYAPSSVGQQETPTPPKQPEFSPQEEIDVNEAFPHVEGCVIDTNMGEAENYFTNEAGQSISNPEGFATVSEIQQTRDIFSSLAELFPNKFTSKDTTELPESFKQFKNHRKAINLLKIEPNLKGSWLIPSHKKESSDTVGY